jgi:hypothetical protein
VIKRGDGDQGGSRVIETVTRMVQFLPGPSFLRVPPSNASKFDQPRVGFRGTIRMLKKTDLREAILDWIRRMPSGTKFTVSDAYNFLLKNFPRDCSLRGDAPNEPRYKHDARAAICWDAEMRDRVVRQTGVRGERQKV